MKRREARWERITRETRIGARVCLDGRGVARVRTGIPFFDHMLALFARHSAVDLSLRCRGDLDVDAHHSVEDCGIVLGGVVREALGDKTGIRRYGAGFDPRNPLWGEAYVPMDETLARCVVDFGGRPHFVWRGMGRLGFKITALEAGQDMSSRFRFGLAREFFQAFANEAKCALHIELLYGEEPHHVVEALFKAFARAVGTAIERDPRQAGQLPSTKGVL
ncbi:MAG TPA: imidazoleglycerol-phosphate dehydratase [Verrucomicrobiota bacterium]|nr:imidazoleglycerol-phosphate dehydratase [Verrucomicrobiota bacterium]HNU53007.1 imidazoleglycerol-phosphate dehydratase [Verrucomicrobiota bacterium]